RRPGCCALGPPPAAGRDNDVAPVHDLDCAPAPRVPVLLLDGKPAMIAFMLGLGLILLGAMAAWGLERRPGTADRFFRWSAVGGCLLALVPAVFLLLGIAGEANGHVPSLACGLKGAFGIDLLSAWFLLIVLGVGATIVAYGVPYLGAERGHRSVRLAHLLLGVLIVALAGVVTARTILAFVVSWEVMAIAAWLLVIFEAETPERPA